MIKKKMSRDKLFRYRITEIILYHLFPENFTFITLKYFMIISLKYLKIIGSVGNLILQII